MHASYYQAHPRQRARQDQNLTDSTNKDTTNHFRFRWLIIYIYKVKVAKCDSSSWSLSHTKQDNDKTKVADDGNVSCRIPIPFPQSRPFKTATKWF